MNDNASGEAKPEYYMKPFINIHELMLAYLPTRMDDIYGEHNLGGDWFSAIAENGQNSRNRHSETELALTWATPLPKKGRGQHMRAHSFRLHVARSSLAHVHNYTRDCECVCMRADRSRLGQIQWPNRPHYGQKS